MFVLLITMTITMITFTSIHYIRVTIASTIIIALIVVEGHFQHKRQNHELANAALVSTEKTPNFPMCPYRSLLGGQALDASSAG